ncbi:MAG: hypothetical protein ABJB47_07565 [Actinomycetota bacterium]
MRDEWTWGNYVLRHLEAILKACPALVDSQVQRGDYVVRPVGGILEYTLSMGFDDGYAAARLTLADGPGEPGYKPHEQGQPCRARVFVAADTRGFHGEDITLPRHGEAAPGAGPASSRRNEATQGLAAFLLEHIHGDPRSLRTERNGSVSFTVIVAPAPARGIVAREPDPA